jgi:hypothetical protein
VSTTRQFLVCVELHGADPESYEDLDDAMASRFFERIVESDGRIRKLPTGTYVSGPSSGDATSVDALRTARAAASEAAETGGLTWSIVVAATSDDLIFDDVEDADS